VYLQIFINSLSLCGVYVLVGIGFFLIYSTAKFLHIAHGVIITWGAYFMFFFLKLRLPIAIVIPISLFMTILLGYSVELLWGRILRKRSSSELVMLLASLGTYIFLQNTISLFFGEEIKSIRTSTVQEGLNWGAAWITPIQIITICASMTMTIALLILLKKTKIGRSMRAVANDPVLANISGINSNNVILWIFVIGSGLAGLAGILVAFDVDMTPTMGMNIIMMGIIAVIIGGNSILGIVFGALTLATVQNLGAWYIGSQWQDAIAFVILVLFLLFKPEGFFGKRIKSATV
jgi:branched-chain amino acid transport system permease protein